MHFFEKYLSIWVLVCIILGVAIGKIFPFFPENLAKLEYAHISLPIVLLIWLMVYPMMLKIDFASIVNATKNTKGLIITCVVNWLIKPFTMYAISVFFLTIVFSFIPIDIAKGYVAGCVLLGAAPCTAMVFVWSQLTAGDPSYTVVQVAVNDLIILVAFIPIVAFLLGVSDVVIPYDTLILSVILFVVVPLIMGILSRKIIVSKKGKDFFENKFIHFFDKVTPFGLLLTLTILFSFQGETILKSPLDVVLIMIPLSIQTFLIFFIAYFWAYLWKLPHQIASPAGMIGASNFFELSVAVSISLFGLDSPASLATVVGVLVEVPIMLILVNISNKTSKYFA